jgi:hypothetical protein
VLCDDVAPSYLQPMLSLEPLKMIVQICKCMISATKTIPWHTRPLYGRGVSAPAFLVRMEPDQIRMEMDSDISDIRHPSFCFLPVSIPQDGSRSDTHGNGFGYLGYSFSYFLPVSIPMKYFIVRLYQWTICIKWTPCKIFF